MTTEIMGQLPCPECGTEQDLKTDGRKHTLKCQDCGTLAYYQSKNSKAHIEQRLKSGEMAPQRKDQTVMLQLPEDVQQTQRFVLSVQPFADELDSITEQPAANDEDRSDKQNEAQTNAKETAEQKEGGGFFGFLEDMF